MDELWKKYKQEKFGNNPSSRLLGVPESYRHAYFTYMQHFKKVVVVFGHIKYSLFQQ